MNDINDAALLLRALGAETAANILRYLNPKEVQKIGSAMTQIGNVTNEQLEQVIDDFIEVVTNQTSLNIGSDDYIRNLLNTALGEDKAGNIIDQILQGGEAEALERLKWLSTDVIVDLIRFEHPQIQTLVICHLEPDQAAEVIAQLPMCTQTEVILRTAKLSSVQPAAIIQLNASLEQQLASTSSGLRTNLGGIKMAADILNFIDNNNDHSLLETLRAQDNILTNKIEELMFIFDDLALLDARCMQNLLREVPNNELILALKGASTAVKDKIFLSMSQRAATILQDDLSHLGSVKVSDVETAQKSILQTARRLAENGVINLNASDKDLI